MKILSSGSYKGIGKYNNDIFNYIDDFCYVIDGASAVFNDNIFFETSDLYSYMNILKNNINNKLDIKNSFIEGIIKSNKYLNNINNYKECELPTYTIAAIKEKENIYELYLLCDCLISILYKDGMIENIEDHRLDETKNKCRDEIKELGKLNISNEERIEIKREIWRKYRKLANAKDGYPVGSTNPQSIDNGFIIKIDKEKVDKILICTDGLYSALGMPNDKWYFEKNELEDKIKNINHNDDLTYILIDNIKN